MTAEDSALCEWATALIDKRISTFEKRRKHVIVSGLDGEALHEVRTSARRLRSALEDLGPLVEHAAKNRRRAKAIGDATGDARDLAVLIAKLSSYRVFAGLRERAEIDRLVGALSRRERHALRQAEHSIKRAPGAKHP
jgi:CHAD domain-containing protein